MASENHLYYRPTEEGQRKIETLRAKVIELDDLIDELLPDDRTLPGSRAKAIAKTKLEEARQRAIEAIVRNHAV